ncbi:ATP-binding cassette domain-containing protein [Bacillus sp. JCM 19041]|uniref:ATP-binding cassette domain-containing protein n=1 Tax=Bacillus sp. JCM 19041 TaxID=1460637 RepID=UPI0006D0E0D1
MKQIVLTAVEKSYGFGKKKTSVLKQVNLTVRHGECLVIYGERESGKTTLLELLAGIKEVDDGEIQVGTCELMFASKEEIAKLRRTTIGIYSQEHVPLLRGLSVADNLEMMRQLSGNKQAFEAQKQAVQTFGIETLLEQEVSTLSSYEREATLFARMVLSEPELLLVDEPQEEKLLRLLIGYARSKRQTLIAATSNKELVTLFPGLVALDGGQVVEVMGGLM